LTHESSPGRYLSSLLNPQSIAVVGASDKPGAGLHVIENLQKLGYRGSIYPVNPKRDDVLGLRCYASLSAIPGPVDCAAVLLKGEAVLSVIEECALKGVHSAWAFASGFAEAGSEGMALQERLREQCLRHNIAFCGPNCVGFVNVVDRVAAFSAPLNPLLQPGKIAVLVQSGSVCLAVANSARGIGFSKIISSGNEAVLDATDYFDYLLDDPQTEVILAFIEGFRQPERLWPVAQRSLEKNKPILLVKVGRSQIAQRATAAHTGALTGSDAVQNSLFRQLGIVRVSDLDELLECGQLFLRWKDQLPPGDRVGMITVSGGEIGLIADLADPLGLRFAPLSEDTEQKLVKVLPPFSQIANPLDAWGTGDLEQTYPRSMEILASDPNIDLLAVSLDATDSLAPRQTEQYAAVARAAVSVAESSGKNIVLFSNVSSGLDPQICRIAAQGNLPFLMGTAESLLALRKVLDYAAFRRQPSTPPRLKRVQPPQVAFLMERHGVLREQEAKQILSAYDIRSPREDLAGTVDQAVRLGQEIGWPVVLKVISAQIPHKTEAGGVALRISDETQLRQAYDRILTNARRYNPQARIDGILVSEMIEDAVAEVLVGINIDPDFGPVVAFGLGGILVELLQDASLRLPPISLPMARAMIQEIRGYPLLSGFRGRPAGDLETLAITLVNVGNLVLDWAGRIRSLDINPLLVLPEGRGVVAADALLELR
jgi:acyl-CoA synthetase (NDP forming)